MELPKDKESPVQLQAQSSTEEKKETQQPENAKGPIYSNVNTSIS